MARFLDEETEREYLDVSSTSESQEAQAGATGGMGLPNPPHQPPLEVSSIANGKWRAGGSAHYDDDSCCWFPFPGPHRQVDR